MSTYKAVGTPIETHAAPRPEHKLLVGQYVTLVPLKSAHAAALYGQFHGENDHVWTYMYEAPFASPEAFQTHIDTKAASTDPLFFAIIDTKTQHPCGQATFMRIDTVNRVIEVGNIIYAPSLQKTPGATEVMYLMAKHAFELGYRRYEWKCNALNEPSKRAAVRFGFTYEGTFRQHLIVKGHNRDTAWFSMLDSEWPSRRAAFETWLSPNNFDAQGKQKIALATLMIQATEKANS